MKRSTYKNLNQIQISKSALKSNYDYFSSLSENTQIAPVLKSNAYGHGIIEVGKYVDKHIKPPFICVDSLYEAYQLQKAGVKTNILIIGYTFPENFKKTRKKLPFHIPVYDLETLKILNKHQPGANVHIKIDTGMNRLGLKLADVPTFITYAQSCDNLNFVGIYSHLSKADDPKAIQHTKEQLQLFKEVLKIFKHHNFSFKWRHISASAGASIIRDNTFNLARVGLGFYGYSPFNQSVKLGRSQQKKLSPALSFISHLIQIKQIQKGDQVSYGGTFLAPKDMTIGILPAGYYEGIERRLSNRGFVSINNIPCQIIGRVCMNLTIIDISNVPNVEVGNEVFIYSSNNKHKNTVKKSAKLANTIPYVLLCHLSESTKRILID